MTVDEVRQDGPGDRSRRMVPHVPGMTLRADAFFTPHQSVNFSPQRHPINVFWHYHEFLELGFVISGRGRHLTDDGERHVARGAVVVVPIGAGHGFRLCEDMVVLNVMLPARLLETELAWLGRDRRFAAMLGPRSRGAESGPRVLQLGEAELVECLAHLETIRSRNPAERSALQVLGRLLLVFEIMGKHLDPTVPPRASRQAVPTVVRAAIDLLEGDIGHSWTLTELSARVFVGPHHLCHQFTRSIGRSPIAYLCQRRAELAAGLLADTTEPVASVGAAVGWPDPPMFSRAFRRVFGQSPRAYRTHSGDAARAGILRPETGSTHETLAPILPRRLSSGASERP